MEVPQGNSLCSYLNQKCHFFLLIQTEQVLLWGRGWYQWERGGGGEMVKDGEYGENTVYTWM
jgi:hypothetical protein